MHRSNAQKRQLSISDYQNKCTGHSLYMSKGHLRQYNQKSTINALKTWLHLTQQYRVRMYCKVTVIRISANAVSPKSKCITIMTLMIIWYKFPVVLYNGYLK